jgi:glycosyltransferase involved in cell wall biosynthesis
MERQTSLQPQVLHSTAVTGESARPLRITFVEPSLGAYRVPLFRGLAARPGIDLTLLYANSGRPNAKPDGFRARQVERKTYHVLGAPVYWQSSQLGAVDRSLADVVCFDWDVHYASLVPALLRAKRQGVATMLFGHGTSKNDGTWKEQPRLVLARLADVLVTYSHRARQAYLDRGWPADRVFAAPNALDLDAIDTARDAALADPATLSDFKAQHGLDKGPVVLFVSRLDRLRRVDVLLEAIRSLEMPGLRLAIVGDGPARGDLEHLAQALGPHDRVLFAGPVYEEAELAKWFCSANVFAFPSYMGLSAIHALAYGLPVVTGNNRWAHGPEVEAVIHERTGLHFAHDDAGAMAVAIRRLAENPTLGSSLGRQGRELVRERYSMPAMISAFEAAIRAAASRAIE